MAPVSVRTDQQRGTLGNRITAWMVLMPLCQPGPVARLEKLRAATVRLKDSKQALSAVVLTQGREWTPSTLLSLGARLMTRVLPVPRAVRRARTDGSLPAPVFNHAVATPRRSRWVRPVPVETNGKGAAQA